MSVSEYHVVSDETAKVFGLEEWRVAPVKPLSDFNKAVAVPMADEKTMMRTKESIHTPKQKTWSIPPSLFMFPFVVILISGLSGAGKNYLADEVLARWLLLKRRLYPCSMAFATPLKIGVHLHHQDEYTWTDVFQTKPPVVRIGLQDGGQVAREKYGIDHWIDQLHDNLLDQVSRGVQVILITDGRYGNEIDYVRDTFPTNSFRIRLMAPQRVQRKLERDIQVFKEDAHGHQVLDIPATQEAIHKIATHPSEQALNSRQDWDLVIDNDYEQGPYAARKVIEAIEKANILPEPYDFHV